MSSEFPNSRWKRSATTASPHQPEARTRRQQRRADRPQRGNRGAAELSQLSRDVDCRRHQRSAEEHRRETGAGALEARVRATLTLCRGADGTSPKCPFRADRSARLRHESTPRSTAPSSATSECRIHLARSARRNPALPGRRSRPPGDCPADERSQSRPTMLDTIDRDSRRAFESFDRNRNIDFFRLRVARLRSASGRPARAATDPRRA